MSYNVLLGYLKFEFVNSYSGLYVQSEVTYLNFSYPNLHLSEPPK